MISHATVYLLNSNHYTDFMKMLEKAPDYRDYWDLITSIIFEFELI